MPKYSADLESLKHFRQALTTFASQQIDQFEMIENEIARTQNELTLAEKKWQGEIEHRRQELQNCYMAQMAASLDCSREENALRQAEEKLMELVEWRARLSEMIIEYHKASERLGSVIENELVLGGAYLEDRIKSLEAYKDAVLLVDSAAPVQPIDQNTNPESKEK